MATDHSSMHLGKRPRRHDPRTLKLGRYVKSTLAPAPPCVDYTRGITNWGMMLNDQLGCCTIAAVAHAVQTWTANAGTEISFPDPVILDYYQTWDGYNPADPATDQGGVELDVLNDWRQQGFAGQALDAYGAIELAQGPHPTIPLLEVMDAIWLFGGAYIGVELPLTAQNQEVWDIEDRVIGRSGDRVNSGEIGSSDHLSIGSSEEQKSNQQMNPSTDEPITGSPDLPITRSPDDPGSWGGHAVYLVAYDQKTLTCITWGQLKKMTWQWFAKYCSEAYGLVAKDWLEASGVSPSGFDLAALENDLKAVTSP